MDQGPVSCIPNTSKMSKAKKVLDESREIQNPELDLADKAISSFEETPGLRKWILPCFTRFLPNLASCSTGKEAWFR
jgi:hypothetical protein